MNGLVYTAAQQGAPAERRFYGVAVAQVINNIDLSGQGRVQVNLPWLPELRPWARVAVPMAGSNQGIYFMPQRDEEVLVAFNQGDVREPFIIGSLWNAQDRPPALATTDAVQKRLIRTPVGHELLFDEVQQSIQLTSSTSQKILIDPQKITLEAGNGSVKVTLNTQGDVTIEAPQSLSLKAPQIKLEGEALSLRGATSVRINGGSLCEIQAGLVKIN